MPKAKVRKGHAIVPIARVKKPKAVSAKQRVKAKRNYIKRRNLNVTKQSGKNKII